MTLELKHTYMVGLVVAIVLVAEVLLLVNGLTLNRLYCIMKSQQPLAPLATQGDRTFRQLQLKFQ
ncbi:MAG: hypothetical protein D3910_24935 [Candidatus Electrothrix sp. ATG2]|nr:hypothetical protein [Candidatus Electrothrix sp. ATG2]